MREVWIPLNFSVADEGEWLDEDVLLLTSSDPAVTALLDSSQEKQDVAAEDNVLSESFLPHIRRDPGGYVSCHTQIRSAVAAQEMPAC